MAAVDPSEVFVAAARERHPGVDLRVTAAEQLPFADGEFDAALAQLVVHFMDDPVRGLAEMARVEAGLAALAIEATSVTRDTRRRCGCSVRLGSRGWADTHRTLLGRRARARSECT